MARPEQVGKRLSYVVFGPVRPEQVGKTLSYIGYGPVGPEQVGKRLNPSMASGPVPVGGQAGLLQRGPPQVCPEIASHHGCTSVTGVSFIKAH